MHQVTQISLYLPLECLRSSHYMWLWTTGNWKNSASQGLWFNNFHIRRVKKANLVDARYCFSLTREMSTMLWSQVPKEIRGLEVVMPQTEIPEWFNFRGNEGSPRFWAHGKSKFPIVALALVFQGVNEMANQSRWQLVQLRLVINF
ncbi:uncharacterized protein LOC133290611 isoform X3 [Gastrolobium bilobum]|uniref:uncharacterized protein LOC133290611 isoform X3 n=1 Tax=Gastrolobium bilobum TaxID=150636 RepID=UPI002AB0BFCB|nr:uncharacterized protein LOC133290611 isoform X3 [Gastrolobium bilobum]XP_061344705.1 uncharacterized protein LOC133290611 isoform X3 [Gastrolobium bilobum]XP_061344707.1 uncharacterized protein LOC133290611 isoform X3 [Gastrolobium bilobum]XP_061344708.1 uncharacterized protein LOC133290611 isoform X3 [Gastrolobium bilobum]